MAILKFIFGDPNQKELNKIQPIVEKINALEPEFEKLSAVQLKEKTQEFKERLAKGETLDDILSEAFAAVREASKRVLGMRHFDVQLLGGIILHQGKISEMRTGEGKTLVATLPSYLNALSGKGVHIVTVNDYLAKRDSQWMGAIYHALGISVAAIGHEQSWLYQPITEKKESPNENLVPISRRDAYAADITYGTNNEFGFDYLRDNMAPDLAYTVQRELNFAIIDEVDSILIDEARTPLIISSPAEESASLYAQFARLVARLKENEDYTIDEKMRSTALTDSGIKKVEEILGISNIYDSQTISLVHHLEEALKAHALFKRDKDYVVKSGEVVIVDEFTGRLMPGRRYSEGLHQAIEAKEGVEVKRESDTLATISFQNLFRIYKKLAGMTGTALTEAEEFYKIYKLEVVEIPTHRPMIRIDHDDLIYKNEDAKFNAVIEEIKNRNEKGQPVLVGTISIEKNERLSRLLKRTGVKHEILNAKHHEREAKIIANAGKMGAVTLATNMAGRGVDIILGGKMPAESDGKEKWEKWESEHEKVVELGGLYVIGTERHEARRIDNQLRGRSGRQGDLGESQFYVSMDDDLMRIFGGERIKGMMERFGFPENEPIHHSFISKSIESAQRKVEGHNFDIRKHLVDYDDVMNKHREVIYRKRRRILELKPEENWLHEEILQLFREEEKGAYEEKVGKYGQEIMRQAEKAIYLRTIDMFWIEHLNAMEQLREGIGLRGYGQRDPLVEYKDEAYRLFNRLISAIEGQVTEILLKMEIQRQPALEIAKSEQRAQISEGASEELAGGAIHREKQEITKLQEGKGTVPSGGVQVTIRKKGETVAPGPSSPQTSSASYPKVGRNDPCPCGTINPATGQVYKYKKCGLIGASYHKG